MHAAYGGARRTNHFTEHRMATSQEVHAILAAVESGSIRTATLADLSRYTSLIAHSNASGAMGPTQYIQVCEVVRLHMLRAMIEAFEERSKVMQNWMLFFAVLAVVAPFVQPLIMAQSTASPTSSTTQAASASASPSQPPVASGPSLAQHPSSYPAKANPAVSPASVAASK